MSLNAKVVPLMAILVVLAVVIALGFDWAMSPAPPVCDTMVSTTTCEPSP